MNEFLCTRKLLHKNVCIKIIFSKGKHFTLIFELFTMSVTLKNKVKNVIQKSTFFKTIKNEKNLGKSPSKRLVGLANVWFDQWSIF